MTMITELNKNLLECANLHQDNDVKMGLIDEWYRNNFLNLAVAIKKDNSLKLIVDIDSFENLEQCYKKLFLLADVLIIRNSIRRTETNNYPVSIPVNPKIYQTHYEYEPKDLPPVLMVPPEANGLWSSTVLEMANGMNAPIAVRPDSYFPSNFYRWITSTGKSLLQDGQMVFAPFIPPLQVESEYISKGFSIPQSYNAQSCFCNNYNWLLTENFHSLLYTNIPSIENIDIETMNKIKNDHYDAYKLFSKELFESIDNIKSQIGTKEWVKEIRYIQKNRIKDNLDKIKTELKKLDKMRSLRKLGYTLTLIGLDISTYLGLNNPFCSLVSAISLPVKEHIERLKEENKLQENPYYFLWKITNSKH